jgi:hypothetical protein
MEKKIIAKFAEKKWTVVIEGETTPALMGRSLAQLLYTIGRAITVETKNAKRNTETAQG